MLKNIVNREDWLNSVIEIYKPIFKEQGYDLPENIRISCGFPSSGGKSGKVIGVVHSKDDSDGGVYEIFINPMVSDSVRVIGVTVHEICHIVVDQLTGGEMLETQHKSPFGEVAGKMGLEKPWKATTESEEFIVKAQSFIDTVLGEYPHKNLNGRPPKKAKRALYKMKCCHGRDTDEQCKFHVYVTKKNIKEFNPEGLFFCPVHKEIKLEVEDIDGDLDND